MQAPTLTAQPGRVGRLTYDAGRQRQRVGVLLDLADPTHASDVALAYQRKYPDRPLRLDVLAEDNWKAPVLQSFELKDYPNGLAAPTAEPAPAMLPATQPANTPTVLRVDGQPPIDAMGQFLFNQQEIRLSETRQAVVDLTEKLRKAKSGKRQLKEKIAQLELELKHKDREYQADLRDMRTELTQQLGEQSKPKGMDGLVEAISQPNHPLAGIVALVAGKVLGPAAGAAPVGGPARSQNMTDILNGIAELIPSEEVGAQLYASLARILPHPDGINQLLILAGLAQPQTTE